MNLSGYVPLSVVSTLSSLEIRLSLWMNTEVLYTYDL